MRAGVLIIGSLLWDNGVRAEWRNVRLNKSKCFHVKAPICYGRMSQTRGNTYTMVFNSGGEMGCGVVIPCLSKIEMFSDLVDEACALWAAEQPSAIKGRISANWGCVGIALRPNSNAEVADGWGEYFRKNARPQNPVHSDGIINIPWPNMKTDDEVDLLLTTCNRADSNRPTPTQVAGAWLNQSEGFERYFFENIRHGIRTPEDIDIWKILKSSNQSWLENPDYVESISILNQNFNA